MPLDHIEMQDVNRIVEVCREDLERLDGKQVLITGASGFLARYLIESWAKSAGGCGSDTKIFLASRRPSHVAKVFDERLNKSSVQIVDSSLADWWKDLSGLDYVLHFGSPSDPALCRQDPKTTMMEMVGGASHVIDIATRSRDCKLLYMSSGAVYGVQPPTLDMMAEDYSGSPSLETADSCYAEAKRFCEVLVQSSNIPFVIARGFSFIGPHQALDSTFAVPDFIMQASTKGCIRIRGDGRPMRSYCYEADAAIVLWKLLLSDLINNVYNVGSDRSVTSIEELARIVSKFFANVPIFIKGERQEGLSPRYVPDCSRQRAVYEPEVGLEEALIRTTQSMKAHGLI